MTKDAVLAILWKNADRFVSGSELASALSVSRTAIWKAVEQLRAEGYVIKSVTHKGYRLSSGSDVLSAEGVEKYLTQKRLSVKVYQSITSTNTVLKGMAVDGAPEGLALVAASQTEGRGRMGRSFYSPADSGVYMSLLLRPDCGAAEATKLTACAAVAAAEAIEDLSGLRTGIKWVNDVLVGGKKVCGILTEASVDCESGMMNYVIIGIGINTRVPIGDFPEELRGIAGAVFGGEPIPELRCRLAAAVLDKLWCYYEHLGDCGFYDKYKERCVVLGRPINILARDKAPEPAVALDIGPDFSLLVRTEDGALRRLNTGEVSIRVQE